MINQFDTYTSQLNDGAHTHISYNDGDTIRSKGKYKNGKK